MTGAPEPGSLVHHYEYSLPDALIARYPAERRDESRLLVLGAGGESRHRRFGDLGELLTSDDLLVVNESKVLAARLLGCKPTGGPSEILLIRPWIDPGDGGTDPSAISEAVGRARVWEALVRPGSKLKPGRSVVISDELTVEILDSVPGGGRLVRLRSPLTTARAIEKYGRVPLPPYIDREDEELDRERYQTVYASRPGSVAAPTAGLHFTPELLARLRADGVRVARITLHVGIGTFRPVVEDDPAAHPMHAESYAIPPETSRAIERTRERGGRVWAVGTTVVRTLESASRDDGTVREGTGSTDLFIRPPFRFRAVDGLLTNFHLPRSTLLMLVAAFGGYERVMRAYEAAVEEGYRFYSYGDAMAVEPARRSG